jgi:hypothetical protein
MSSAFGQYHHYSNQGQLLVSTQALNYGQDNGRRSKSPMSTSMINHPRHSPVPLSTPPHSRNSSQPPEQLPNQLIYEDVGGSPSDSPTSSIATPDQDASEIDMMDFEVVHNYHDHQNAAMVSSHMQQDTIPAIDTTHYLPDQGKSFNQIPLRHLTRISTAGCPQCRGSFAESPVSFRSSKSAISEYARLTAI